MSTPTGKGQRSLHGEVEERPQQFVHRPSGWTTIHGLLDRNRREACVLIVQASGSERALRAMPTTELLCRSATPNSGVCSMCAIEVPAGRGDAPSGK